MLNLYRENKIKAINKLKIAYIKEYIYVYSLKKAEKIKCSKKELQDIYIEIMVDDSIRLKNKIIVFLYWNFPIIIQKLRRISYKLNFKKR